MCFYAYLNGVKPVGSSRSHLIIFAMTLNHVRSDLPEISDLAAKARSRSPASRARRPHRRHDDPADAWGWGGDKLPHAGGGGGV